MIAIPRHCRPRLFTTPAVLSLIVCVTSLILWNASWDKPQLPWRFVRLWRVGSFEIIDQSNRLSIHHVGIAEQSARDRYAAHLRFMDDISRALAQWRAIAARAQWDSPLYRDTMNRLKASIRARDVYLPGAPSKPAESMPEVILPLPLTTGLAAILPVVLIVRKRQPIRARIRSIFARYFRWEPASELTWFQRARRKLFAAISIGSSVLAFLIVLIWARSYLVSDEYVALGLPTGQPGSRMWQTDLMICGGTFSVSKGYLPTTRGPVVKQPTINPVDYYALLQDDDHPQPPRWHKMQTREMPPKARSSYGFHFQTFGKPSQFLAGYAMVTPFWFVTFAFAILPGLWLLIHWKRKPKPGYCPRCDYDLTANTSGVCPECGTAVRVIAALEVG